MSRGAYLSLYAVKVGAVKTCSKHIFDALTFFPLSCQRQRISI